MKRRLEWILDYPPCLLFMIMDKVGLGDKIDPLDNWIDALYYRSCGTRIRWRIMFELTGQGHGARRALRMQRRAFDAYYRSQQ